jgi:phosphoglycolate phosphatase
LRVVRSVLFDIDGTLVRTGGAGVKAFARVFENTFGAVDGFEKLKFAGRTDVSLVREFFAVHHIPATNENFEIFFERYIFWLDHILSESQMEICPGALDFIHGLRALEEPPALGLLTGNIRLGAEIKLRRAGLWDYFVVGAFADDAEDRDQIATIARDRSARYLRESFSPAQVVVIGDTPLDIRCARAIGAKVLAVATGGAPLPELVSHSPDWAVESLREISPAKIIATK